MKKILLLSTIVFFAITASVIVFISCDKKEEVKNIEPVKSLTPVQSTFLDDINNSLELDYFMHFASGRLGDLDMMNIVFQEVEYGGIDYQVANIPTIEKRDDIFGLPTTTPRATFLVFQTIDGGLNCVIYDYSNLEIDGENFTGNVSIRLMNDLEIYVFQLNSEGPDVILDGADIDLLPEVNVDPNPNWWDCTTNCYKTAKDACNGDPECKTLCRIANFAGGACDAAMMVSCGIHCAKGIVYIPSINDIINFPALYQYGFYTEIPSCY